MEFNQKVRIPKTKSVGFSLKGSKNIRIAREKGQKFLYFKFISPEGWYVLGVNKDSKTGDYFGKKDVVIRAENEMKW